MPSLPSEFGRRGWAIQYTPGEGESKCTAVPPMSKEIGIERLGLRDTEEGGTEFKYSECCCCCWYCMVGGIAGCVG